VPQSVADNGLYADSVPMIHESVIRRMAAGTDGYSPIVIPAAYRVTTKDGRILPGQCGSARAPSGARVELGLGPPRCLLRHAPGIAHIGGYAGTALEMAWKRRSQSGGFLDPSDRRCRPLPAIFHVIFGLMPSSRLPRGCFWAVGRSPHC
jgi:hypothetical protein